MRKPPPSSRLRLEEWPTQKLIVCGETFLAAHDYKNAIDVYKLLLKREPQDRWRETLTHVYLERAKQLASKGMYREAAVLWENIPSLCGQTRQPELYIDWLLHTGQYAKAMHAYGQHAAAGSGTSALEIRLAALALAGQKEVLQMLPQAAPLRRQLELAEAALRSYSQGETEAVVREHLHNISIRSPYRDLRQTLFALLKLESDPAGAATLVERIAPTSPYHDLAEAVRACAAREPNRAILALDSAQRDLTVHLRGFDPQHIKLIKEWARLGEQPSDKAVFGFIVNHVSLLDQNQARQACRALLTVYPKGQSTYIKLFGSLSSLAEHHLQALQAEQERDAYRALYHWQACVDELVTHRKNPDHRLMAALVLRQMAEIVTHKESDEDDVHAELCAYLKRSLEFDPEDRETYLKLATLYQEVGEDKAYHQWVEQAVKQFPDDPQVLMAAVTTATVRKAHKKAAGFARRVLEIDPINSQARTVLINAHLAHARKQIVAGKYELAAKELESASPLERDKNRTGIIEINRGLLAFQQRQPELMMHWLKEGVGLVNSPLLGWFRLAVEAARLKLEPTLFQRELGLGDPNQFTATRTDLLTLTQWINTYQEEGVNALRSILKNLDKPLKRAMKGLTKEDDFRAVCECFHQVPHYTLLEYAASRALQHPPERPIFIYHQIYGRVEGEFHRLDEQDDDRLAAAFQEAKNTGDHRTAMRIAQLMHQSSFFRSAHSSQGGSRSTPIFVPPELEKMRADLQRMPPALREQMLNTFLDSLPLNDDFPPHVQRAIMKALLLAGDELEELQDSDSDDLSPPSRGRPKHRRR